MGCSTTPLAVSGGLTFVVISAGFNFTCVVTSTQREYCWGYKLGGQLGNGTTMNSTVPVAVAGQLKFSGVSAGKNSACGVSDLLTAYCWGDSGPTPLAIPGGLPFWSISVGGDHTCGVVAPGDAYCWGDNHHGQLGNPTPNGSTTPVFVIPPGTTGLGWKAVMAGGSHTCGVTSTPTDDGVFCWGAGTGASGGDSFVPVLVVGP
jgi:alpha-tubulin suppressor-like RCC1 family protein